jgi:chromosomal replication initiation ATPase DnaA
VPFQLVCKEYGLSPEELRTPAQSRLAAEARAVVGWLASELGNAAFVAVGEAVGRDLSTISSAVRRLAERTGHDAALGRRLEAIKVLLDF